MKRLVVVESPTKAKTIRKFLPKDGYKVMACVGHIRDLPGKAADIPKKYKDQKWARLGVNPDDDFSPLYVVHKEKAKVIKELKAALKEADELYIATDEDREGESIGWHLLEVLNPKVPTKRMVFHEITKEAILSALEDTRDIDQRLVNAQETRRILDRLVGYMISPLLWRKVAPRLSAGRVQSVAVRVIVLREKERIAFVSGGYWDIRAELEAAAKNFDATLVEIDGKRIATGKDFDENTGKIADGKDVRLITESEAKDLAGQLEKAKWNVSDISERQQTRKPPAPFITSTLQQDANKKFGMSARDTMRTAQRLYEQGLITYMRTDSTHLSEEAVTAARKSVESRYGKDFLSAEANRYGKNSDSAQEAHEAIRPAGTEMKTVAELGLSDAEAKIYDLIWKRTVAGQMANAKHSFTTVTIEATDLKGDVGDKASFRATGKTILFAGFERAYVEGSDDPAAALEDQESPLPEMTEGDSPDCKSLEAIGHETKPPARYTEARLVQELEKAGVGRPSTYASIISTIISRGYVWKNGRQLVPSFTAFATNNLLEFWFERLVDTGFTSRLETSLDEIAKGNKEALPFLKDIYYGDGGLEAKVESGLDEIDAKEISTITFPKWDPYLVRVGKFGAYTETEVDGERITSPLPAGLAADEVTSDLLRELLENKQAGDDVLGVHPEFDLPILLKNGPYGPYVQLGEDPEKGSKKKPKRTSIPKGMEPSEVDFAIAVKLLSLPRTLGNHPETDELITAAIGRFGPYVKQGSTYASIKEPDNVLDIELDRAIELVANKATRGKQSLRNLGNHPDSGEPIEIFSGRYGPYVKHKKTNASLPKGAEVETVTLETALELIAKKEEKKKK